MTDTNETDLQAALSARYGDAPEVAEDLSAPEVLAPMVGRGSCRQFSDAPVPSDLLRLVCATALASPSKSDLQQRDIILLTSAETRRALSALVPDQQWVGSAPMLLVFCGNNRRQRLMHDWHDIAFANDHLDAFFNAVGDAAIALGAFVTAAEALGLGCCPISGIRNNAQAVSDLLNLPNWVFPFAGLAVGYPDGTPKVSMRLPLQVTCHEDAYSEDGLQAQVRGYDAARANAQPYRSQRYAEVFGEVPTYGWSEDKVRQYSRTERADFGAYVRRQGFSLD